MIRHDSYIEELIIKSFSERLSEEEQTQLNEWMCSNERHPKHFNAMKKAWEVMPKLKAMQAFDAKVALPAVKEKIQAREVAKAKKSWKYHYRNIAAVVAVPLFISTLFLSAFLMSGKVQKQAELMQTVAVKQGMTTNFQLSDGTEVWLNSGSTLKFPMEFKGNSRKVTLNGEAYFEVEKDVSKPFFVNTKNVSVKVLGTAFNVVSFADDVEAEVVLKEGKVRLMKNSGDAYMKIGDLLPGQRAVYNTVTGQNITQQVDPAKYLAWRNGELIFDNDPMTEVVKRLNRRYNVEIVISDTEIKSYSYRASFRDESLEQVLELLKKSAPIDYKLYPSRELPSGEYTAKRVYLYKEKS